MHDERHVTETWTIARKSKASGSFIWVCSFALQINLVPRAFPFEFEAPASISKGKALGTRLICKSDLVQACQRLNFKLTFIDGILKYIYFILPLVQIARLT